MTNVSHSSKSLEEIDLTDALTFPTILLFVISSYFDSRKKRLLAFVIRSWLTTFTLRTRLFQDTKQTALRFACLFTFLVKDL